MEESMKYRQAVVWTMALIIGGVLGALGWTPLDRFMDFVATAYTRCFQFVAVPTVALAILTAIHQAFLLVIRRYFAC